MIHRSLSQKQSERWQQLLTQGVRNPQTLLQLLELSDLVELPLNEVIQEFPLRVPLGFVARMKKGDPQDPLLRQILPLNEELKKVFGYTKDPVGDDQDNIIPGLIHRFHGRVLLTIAGACAVNCRYCFRRHFPYRANNLDAEVWKNILNYIAEDMHLHEVIFSGGDPLLVSDEKLIQLMSDVIKIPHVKRLRIHSRIPIVLPERITQKFLDFCENTRVPIVLIVHCNHANEIDHSVISAVQSLKKANVTVLNQAVLLKDVNDNAETLIELHEALFDAGILPYYLHLLDKVAGSAHFDVPEKRAKQLMRDIAARLPGYLVPKLARAVSGKTAKKIISY